MSKATKVLVVASLITVGAGLAMASHAEALPGTPPTNGYRMAQAIEQVSGTVLSVEQVSRANQPWTGTHLSLQTGTQTLDVALGPSDYVDAQGVRLQAGDRIVVTGVRTDVQGQPTLVAYEVRKGDQTLRLRTENGMPLWAGRGRRP